MKREKHEESQRSCSCPHLLPEGETLPLLYSVEDSLTMYTSLFLERCCVMFLIFFIYMRTRDMYRYLVVMLVLGMIRFSLNNLPSPINIEEYENNLEG